MMIPRKKVTNIFEKSKKDRYIEEMKLESERMHTHETLKLLCGLRVRVIWEYCNNRRIVYKINKEDYEVATEWLFYLENALWDGIHVMLTSYPDKGDYYVIFDLKNLKY